MRTFLNDYENEYPNDVIHVEKPIRCKYEISAIAIAFERKSKFPLLIFHNPVNTKEETSKFPEKIDILEEIKKTIRLEAYLSKEKIESEPNFLTGQ